MARRDDDMTHSLRSFEHVYHLRKMYIGDCAQPVPRRNRHQEPLRVRITIWLIYAGVYGAALASAALFGACVLVLIWILLAIGRAVAGGE